MSSQEPDNTGSPENPTEPHEAEASSTVEAAAGGRPGAKLMAERRAQGLSLGDVARQLKLSVRQVEALERDEYGAFPGPVFVRGFLRNYAKLLHLEPEALVTQAGIAAVPAAPPTASTPAAPVPLQEPRAGRRSRFGFGTLAVVLVLIVLIVAAVYDARNKPVPVSLAPVRPPATTQAPAPQHADSLPPSSPEAAAAPAPSLPSSVTTDAANATGAGESAGPTGSPPAAAPAAAPPVGAAPSTGGLAELRLTFDDESWVEIKDASGTLIFSRLNSPGSEQTVSGEPPLDLVIGNAQSVRLIYRGKAVDLAPHTRVDVARVRLD